MNAPLQPYSQRRDSEVTWLGEVPAHWQDVQLGRIGRFSKGSGGTKEDEVPDGIPCIRYGDLYSKYGSFITQARSFVAPERAADYTPVRFGDLLFAGSGETLDEIGKSAVNLIESDVVCGGDVLVFRPNRKILPRFLGYAADCPNSIHQKARMGRGITVMHIYADELKYLHIALPPIAEQWSIVRFLDHIDLRVRSTIRAKQKLLALLNEQKQAVIHRAVTRGFEPGAPVIPSGYPWLGDILARWRVAPFGKLIELTAGFPFKSQSFSTDEADVRLLRGVNVAPDSLRWDAVVRWPARDASLFLEFALRPGDIVLGMDRPIIAAGVRVAVVREDDVPSLLLQRVCRIRPHNALDSRFAMLLLGGKTFTDYLTPIFTGISVPHVSPDQIRAFRVPLPTLDEQRAIVRHVEEATASVVNTLASVRRETELLREYRTRLIADVVTGQLDVRDAAAQLSDEVDEEEPPDEDVEASDDADVEDLKVVEA